MILISSIIFIVAVLLIVGTIEAIRMNKNDHQDDSDSAPDIMIGMDVPGPFDAFKKDDKRK